MPQSLVKLFVHIVFSTKHHQNFITPELESDLYSYLGGICRSLECNPVQIGGTSDHIHVLCNFSKKITLIHFMEEIKKSSSKWAKTKGEAYKSFYWQDGYGAFSVNPVEIDVVKAYIANQKEHHRRKSFKEEFIAFLKKYNVDYDERYIWD